MTIQERKLHPEDLFLAREVLIELRDPTHRSRMQEAARRVPQIVEVWNKERWSWHNDVPSGRMYVFGGLYISKEENIFDQRYDEMLAWFESEISRVEHELVRFYLEHQPVVELHVTSVAKNDRKPIKVPSGLFLFIPLFMIGSAGWQMMHSDGLLMMRLNGIFLIGGWTTFIVMYLLRKRIIAESVRQVLG